MVPLARGFPLLPLQSVCQGRPFHHQSTGCRYDVLVHSLSVRPKDPYGYLLVSGD